MAAGGHFGCPKITLGRISGHFRSIRNFFLFFFTKWLPSAILDVRNSLWITFLAILDQYRFIIYFLILDQYIFLIFFTKWLPVAFWMSENHFRSHFYPFHIDTQLYFFEIFDKMDDVGHFGCPKFTFDRILDGTTMSTSQSEMANTSPATCQCLAT